jgi:hypothetical protein
MAIDPKNKKIADETSAYVQDTLISVGAKIAETIKDSIETAFDGANAGAIKTIGNDLNRTFNSLVKSSSEFSANSYKVSQGLLSSKDISKQIVGVQIKRIELENKINTAKKMGVDLNQESVDAAKEALKEQDKQLNLAEQKVKEIEKNMGMTGEIFQRLGKTKFFGGLVNASGATENMRKAAAGGAKGFELMTVGAKSMAKALNVGPLAILAAIVKVAQFFVSAMFRADELATKTAKAFGLTKKNAEALNHSLDVQTGYLLKGLYTTEDMVGAYEEFVGLTGAVQDSTKSLLLDQNTLTHKMGIAGDEAAYLNVMINNQGKSTKEVFNNVNDIANAQAEQNGYLISGQMIFKEIASLSAGITANYGNNIIALSKANLQTRRLGVNLKQAANVADGLLNFEQSITAELEAEILLGQQFNFERARALAATGDIAGATEEVLRQTKNLNDEQLRSPIVQKAIAAATGLSVEEFMKARQITKMLTADQGKLQKKLNDLSSDKERAAYKEQLLEGAKFEDIKKTRTAQEKFNVAISNAKDQFADLIGTGFLPFLTKQMPKLLKMLANFTGAGKEYAEMQQMQALQKLEDKDGKKLYNSDKAKELLAVFESGKKKQFAYLKAASGIENKKERNRLKSYYALTGEEEAAQSTIRNLKVDDFTIKTNPKDTLVMAGGTQFGKETNGLLRQLISAVEGGKVINLEGRKVGETLVMSSYKS